MFELQKLCIRSYFCGLNVGIQYAKLRSVEVIKYDRVVPLAKHRPCNVLWQHFQAGPLVDCS